jgi:hypothetical protein
MSPRRELELSPDQERALHGASAGGAEPWAEGAIEPWELVVAALELALLARPLEAPPPGLAERLAQRLLAQGGAP